MFIEQDHHHWKNKQDAHYAAVKPAILANGEPGVWVRIGGTFAVLSKDDYEALAGRIDNAINQAETENQK